MAHYEVKDFPTYIRVMHVEQEVSGGDETVMVRPAAQPLQSP